MPIATPSSVIVLYYGIVEIILVHKMISFLIISLLFEGNASNTQQIDENTTSSRENTENEYDTIENIQSSINTETAGNQRSDINLVNNDEDINVNGNIRIDRVSSEESLVDENQPIL